MKKTILFLAAALMLLGVVTPVLNAAIVEKPVVMGDDPLPVPPPPPIK